MSTGKTTEVLTHHLQSFGAGDVEELMKDYTDESVVITHQKTFKGLDEIKGLLTEFVTNLLPPGCKFEMIRQDVIGDVAYIAWSASTEKVTFHLGTDTFVVRDGKIAVQTFAAQVEPK